MKDREEITHPSFGMISISKVYGNKHSFFGSELMVDHWIEIQIKHGEMQRELSNDWFHASDRIPIVTVALTPIQFAELITNMNFGDGMPCTIEDLNGERIAPYDDKESKKDATHRQFKVRMKEFAASLIERKKKAADLIKKKTLSKDDQHELNMLLDSMTQELSSNIPFFMECFQEVADRVVAEAKGHIEAAITHKVQQLGLDSLKNSINLLGDGK